MTRRKKKKLNSLSTNMKIFKIVITVFAFSTFFSCNKKVETKTEATKEEQIEYTTKFEPTWESLKKAKPAKWWSTGKFGIFIHWGPYSVAGYKDKNKGYAEAITNHMYKKPEAYANFMKKKFGATMPDFGYKDMVPMFTAKNWNPDAWAQLFKDAGATYVIPTAEHHDGFANWDSDLTEWNATKKGPMRDLVGDLGKSVREKGLKYGLSYHRERHPNRFTLDFKVYDKPFDLVAEEIKRMPESANLYGPFEYSDAFIADYVARWKEMETKYQPDFMWLDDAPIFYKDSLNPQVTKFKNAFKGMIADYLNTAQKWGKEVYFNNKGKHLNFPKGVGCREKDNLQMESIGAPYQNPATLGVSYAYMENEEINDLYKKPAELVRLLVDVVSKNGNLLLNIGPKADGTIPEGMQKRLLAMGSWLKVNGEAIYETTPWNVYGEFYGDIIEEDDVIYNKHSMRIHELEYRYTSKGKSIYMTTFQNNNSILLKSFKNIDGKIKDISILGSTKKVNWSLTKDGLSIKDSELNNFKYATVYKIVLQ